MKEFDSSIPVLNHHCHVCFPHPIDEALQNYEKMFQRMAISGAGLLSCPGSDHNGGSLDVLENLKMLYLKDRLSIPCYAYAGFTWHGDDAGAYGQFARDMLEMGFDGFKTLEMHPRLRKRFGKGLNHPSFSEFFRVLSDHECVMVNHVGDPRGSWNCATATEEAIRLGRVYDESHLTLDQLHAEMEEVVARYRKIKFIFAHFYFISDNYDRCCQLMEENPNFYLDLTPGAGMCVNFNKDPELWYDFFLRYADRIILGSDLYGIDAGEDRYDLTRNFLEGTSPIPHSLGTIYPMPRPLPREALDKIYRENVLRLQGCDPRPINRKKVLEYARSLEKEYAGQLTDLARQNLKTMLAYWEK